MSNRNKRYNGAISPATHKLLAENDVMVNANICESLGDTSRF